MSREASPSSLILSLPSRPFWEARVDSVAPTDRAWYVSAMEDKTIPGNRASQCLYVFVKWLEDPTKWNVVPVKHGKSKGELKTGQAVEVKW